MTLQAISLKSEADRTRWNEFVTHSPYGHLMQLGEWGEFKRAEGWQVHYIGLENNGRLVGGTQLLLKSLPILPLNIAYIPKGPIFDLTDKYATNILFSALHNIAKENRAIFLKIEPNLKDNDQYHIALKNLGFQPSKQTNQPRSTIIVNLADDEAAIFARVRKKTRKLIRRADQNGIEVTEGTEADLNAFYKVMEETAHAKKIPVHSQAFYKHAWDTFSKTTSVRLILAKYQGRVVAAKMIFLYNNVCMHFWGGTALEGRDLFASYLIQWETIKWAKRHGYKYADLWGIPDEIAAIVSSGNSVPKNKQGGLWGVYNFKRGFGGEIESCVGAYDYVYRPFWYTLADKIMKSSSVDAVSYWLEMLQR